MNLINIAFVGTISAGKTTLLNAIFTEPLGNVHIKKTTLLPHIYHETTGPTQDSIAIKCNTDTKNGIFLKSIEDGNFEKLEEINYNVNKIIDFVTFRKDIYLVLYDIPGLNDSTTKEIYYNYIDSIFMKINIIVWTVDVNSSINTSDEIDICNKLITGIKNNYDKYRINTKLIILLNKCDDMYIGNQGNLVLDEDRKYMYDQAKKIIDTRISSIYPEYKYDMITISSENAYIYRMIKKGSFNDLDMKYMNKLGYNEYSKSEWNNFSENEKKGMIHRKLDIDMINNRMINTGFNNFRNVLQCMINERGEMNFLLDRIKSEMYAELKVCKSKMYYSMEAFKGFQTNINRIILEYNISDMNENLINDQYKKCINSVIDMFEKNNGHYINLKSIDDKTIEKLIDIKSFYDNVYSFNDSHSILCSEYLKISQLINKYYIYKVGNVPNFNDKLDYVKQLKIYNFENWMQLLISCFASNDLFHSMDDSICMDILNKCKRDFNLNDVATIDIILTLLDSNYANYFKTANTSKILVALKFWNDMIIRSDNPYSMYLFKMIRLLDRYILIKIKNNYHESNTYNCTLEKYLFDILTKTYPNNFIMKDDLFIIF